VINTANQITCIDADNSHTCNGAEFNWVYDKYGNLTSDGANTYTYRCICMSRGQFGKPGSPRAGWSAREALA
jgi:hypothetical protein